MLIALSVLLRIYALGLLHINQRKKGLGIKYSHQQYYETMNCNNGYRRNEIKLTCQINPKTYKMIQTKPHAK